MPLKPISLEAAFMAVEGVRERLLRAAAALERAKVPYAVIGGNAVAAWVSRVDPDAVRTTKEVDILIRRADLPQIAAALDSAGFELADVHGITCFVEKSAPSPKRGIHCLFAEEPLGPHHVAPSLDETVKAPEGFSVIGLAALIRMKLIAFRDRDRVHLRDMLELGLIRAEHEAGLPADLLARLELLKENPEEPLG
ncbi:MAG: hypothetical protein IT450_06885 [Phycisphaerales bacterium]|nr:hypothetical protein [Phycisphaerales bacterium]